MPSDAAVYTGTSSGTANYATGRVFCCQPNAFMEPKYYDFMDSAIAHVARKFPRLRYLLRKA